MSPSSRVLGDVFEQLKGQASHTDEETGVTGQPQVDPQQIQRQQQIAKLRQLDEARRQESLKGLRQQQVVMARWDNERKKREVTEGQQQTQEQRQAEAKKQEKRQIRQLQRREKEEVLSVKRAKTQVEARMGKF